MNKIKLLFEGSTIGFFLTFCLVYILTNFIFMYVRGNIFVLNKPIGLHPQLCSYSR